MTQKAGAPKKRGRRSKDQAWQQAPRNGVDLTFGNANAFADKIFAQLPPRSVEMYHYWCDRYDEAATSNGENREKLKALRLNRAKRTERIAKGYANKKTSEHFGCDIKTVGNRTKWLMAASKKISAWRDENVFPRMRQYNEDVQRLIRAMTLLHHSAYADLERIPGVKAGGNSCRFLLTDAIYENLEPTLLSPDCLAQFQSAEGAKLGTLQRLTSVLAAAFTRAHAARVAAEQRAESAERELRLVRQKHAADIVTGGAYGGSAKRK